MAAPIQLVVMAYPGYPENVIHIRDKEGMRERFMPRTSNGNGGPSWISTLTARELESLKNELNPCATNGSHMTLSHGDKSEEEVVHILENYGFRIVKRGLFPLPGKPRAVMVTEMEK